ncbi:MAG: hypothetical protein HYV09_15785 [Deltaproteobacteria bacterium]|nr:hypothetical protein [Deltaproteobacteria bacterium]
MPPAAAQAPQQPLPVPQAYAQQQVHPAQHGYPAQQAYAAQQPQPAPPGHPGYEAPHHPAQAPQPHDAGPPSSHRKRPSEGKLGAQTVVGVASPVSQRAGSQGAGAQGAGSQGLLPQGAPGQPAPHVPHEGYAAPSHPGFAPAPPPPSSGRQAAAQVAAPQPAGASGKKPLGATMIGVGLLPGVAAGQQPAPSPQAKPNPKATLLGVALPGIAPTHEPPQFQAPPPFQASPQQPQPGYAQPQPGYAQPQPGYAQPQPGYPQQAQPGYPHQPQPGYPQQPQPGYPHHGYAQPQPPAHAQYPEHDRASLPPESSLPVKKPSRAIPIALAIVALIGIVVALVLVLRPSGPPPLTSAIEGDASAPKLVVKCATCADGSMIDLGGKSATFTAGAASIALAGNELKAGRNTFRGKITPKGEKPHDVELEVGIPHLVRPSLAPLSKGDAKVDVVFDLAPDVQGVTVDGTAIDGSGEKTHAIAIPKPAEDARVFEKTVKYEVRPKSGAPIKGSLKLAIPYASLRVGLPGRKAFVLGEEVEVSGKTAPGATVVVGDARLTADGSGVFKGRAKVGKDDAELRLRAFGEKLAPREVVVPLTRAGSADEVQKLLRAEAKTPFDKAAEKPDEFVGKVVAVKVEIAQIGEEDGRVVAVGEAKCAAAETKCPAVRVLVAPGATVAKGDVIEVLGVIVRGVPMEKTKTTAVEIDASWIRGK